VTGTFLNVGCILLGGLAGLTFARQLSGRAQHRLKLLLTALTLYAGFGMVWDALKAPLGHAAGQLGIALLSLSLGSFLGYLLRLQRGMNRFGQMARVRYERATGKEAGKSGNPADANEGFLVCTILFCVGPLALVGTLLDGVAGDWRVLAVKGLLDGLAAMGFVAAFGWSPLLAAVPVLAWQGTLTLLARLLAPLVESDALRDSLGLTGGLIVAMVSLVILDLRRVPLANYLPALGLAPLLTWWWQ